MGSFGLFPKLVLRGQWARLEAGRGCERVRSAAVDDDWVTVKLSKEDT